MKLSINLDKYHGHVTTCYTLITDQPVESGQDVTLVDSDGGTFCKTGEVVSVCLVNLKDHKTLPSIIAWVTCGTNSIRAVEQLKLRYKQAEHVTVVVVKVK